MNLKNTMLSESVTQECIHYFHLYKVLEQTKFQLYGVPYAIVGEIKKRENNCCLWEERLMEKGRGGTFSVVVMSCILTALLYK